MAFTFSLARLPRVEFGGGSLDRLPGVLDQDRKTVLVGTGAHSFLASEAWAHLEAALRVSGFEWEVVHVRGEPSPALVDEAVRAWGASLRSRCFIAMLRRTPQTAPPLGRVHRASLRSPWPVGGGAIVAVTAGV